MKKIIAVMALVLVLASAAFSGNIAVIIATDVGVGAAAGAALGSAIATPFFIAGGSTDGSVYLTGASWGFIAGAGAGLIYSIWNIVYYMEKKQDKPVKKAYLGTEELHIAFEPSGFKIESKF